MPKQSLTYLVLVGLVGLIVGYFVRSTPSPTMSDSPGYGRGSQYGGSMTQSGNNSDNFTPTRDNCLADDCLMVADLEYPADELPAEVIEALDAAIDDEYKALSTYLAVIDEFGAVRPFSMIKGAEESHIASLKAVYDKYGLEAPENEYLGNIAPPSTLANSCALGVEAEIANAALYRDQLLPAVTVYPDITAVFNNLMSASENKHLPSFERCAN